MSDSKNARFRESTPFWRDEELLQNFGDFLTVYLLDRLFVRTPRLPGDIRIVGSILDDYHVDLALKRENLAGIGRRANLIAWSCGVRAPGSLSRGLNADVEILSVRGPLSASDLGLGSEFPIGDPGLLLPALYRPKVDRRFSGRSVCVPHFWDDRTDDEIRVASGADLVLRPAIAADLQEIESFLDALTSARFAVCGSLHAAIARAAYGQGFGYWDSGRIDLPFKWEDFSASINIPCKFFPDVATASEFYQGTIRESILLPSMWSALAVAPFPIRPDALLSVLMHQSAESGRSIQEELEAAQESFRKFAYRLRDVEADSSDLVDDLARLICAEEARRREADERLQDLQGEMALRQTAFLDDLRGRDAQIDGLMHDLAVSSSNVAKLLRHGSRLAETTRKAYARPWRPMKVAVQRGLLKAALAVSGVLPEKKKTRLAKSLEKRRPRKYVADWRAFARQVQASATASSVSDRAPAASNSELEFSQPQPRVLVADYRIPRPDVSAGEKATFGLLKDLREVGFQVTFLPTDMEAEKPYIDDLADLGVNVVTRQQGYADATDFVRRRGGAFDVFYLVRVDVAEALVTAAREASPGSRIIFHAPDLYFVRESRAAELMGNSMATAAAEAMRRRETAIIQAVDHTVLISPAEIPFLEDVVPLSKLSVCQALYSEIENNPVAFAERQHVFFLGGYKHRPNVDAVRWFADNIWPLVHAALPDVEFHILGAEAPPDVVELASRPGVRYIGYVADLEDSLQRYRLSVAPIRYGAGIKGKLAASMGSGVPSVCTSIAAEGMSIEDGRHAMVRDDPLEFAEAVTKLYQDEGTWARISEDGRRHAADMFGSLASRSAFLRALDKAKAVPVETYIRFCRSKVPAPLPVADPSQNVEVSVIVPVHNQWRFTRACLNSLDLAVRGTSIPVEVILADDASTDETLGAARRFPGLRVVRQETNQGFLINCNRAADVARGTYLLFLNNDTVVMPNWLTELISLMEQEPDAAIVGSKLLYPDGTIQEAGGVLFSDATASNLGRGKARTDPMYSFSREVDYETGASILVRRKFWDELKGFDPRFAPAYCEDSDLAMQARDRRMRVVYAAGSEVIHFEHGTYGEQISSPVKVLAAENTRKLREKWHEQFTRDHLPPSVEPETAAAFAERSPPASARRRRHSGRLNILYFSPFPSHPDNHGNQATIQSFGRRFQSMGHRVHFALLKSPMFDEAAERTMKMAWDSLDILPNELSLLSEGKPIAFDGWYQQGLGENIRLLCNRYDVDVVFCSYVFQSRLLDFVPRHVLKIIDTHDKMGDRYDMLRRKNQPLEFFSCTPEEEGRYLRRADIVVARRQEEAEYFNDVSGRDNAIVIPHVEEPNFIQRRYDLLGRVGMVASANRINLSMTLDFLKALASHERDGRLPFRVEIAGQVSSMIAALDPADAAYFGRPWVTLHGYVPTIETFYRSLDLVVAPVTMGTGINVKTVQAMAFGMPLVTTSWGAKGIETDHRMHDLPDLQALARVLFELHERPDQLNELAEVSRYRYTRFFEASIHSMQDMFSRVTAGNV
jgi:GT2 family glycosyltransferase/glycosyltransferase involved in cell wall biosynthesis